jgi:hypothetical protein
MSKKTRQPVEKSKAWERKRPFERRFETQEPNVTFLIVCEGEKTEPLYFEGFRVKSAKLIIRGEGNNTVNLVRIALRLRDQQAKERPPYDQVWCVFDREISPPNTLTRRSLSPKSMA